VSSTALSKFNPHEDAIDDDDDDDDVDD